MYVYIYILYIYNYVHRYVCVCEYDYDYDMSVFKLHEFSRLRLEPSSNLRSARCDDFARHQDAQEQGNPQVDQHALPRIRTQGVGPLGPPLDLELWKVSFTG